MYSAKYVSIDHNYRRYCGINNHQNSYKHDLCVSYLVLLHCARSIELLIPVYGYRNAMI